MATRNIVPRATGEGGIGTSAKRWALGWINALVVSTLNALTLTAQAVGFTVSGGTTSKTLTVEDTSLVNQDLTSDAGPTFAHIHLSDLAAVQTAAESWVGPSSTAAIYFKGGNVGIGTTSPSQKLDVWGNLNVATSSTPVLFADASTGRIGINTNTFVNSNDLLDINYGGANKFYVRNDGVVAVSNEIRNGAMTQTTAGLRFGNTTGHMQLGGVNGSGNAESQGAEIDLYNTGATPAGVVLFRTGVASVNNQAEVMRIDSNGNVGIGTTGPSYLLHLASDSAGKPGAGGLWTVVSDERIKADIVPADLDRCWEICHPKTGIPLKYFGWADGVYTPEQVRDRHSLGWVAQDAQSVFGKAVNVHPFNKVPVLDGEEEYQEQATETVTVEQSTVEMIDGKPVLVTKLVEQQQPLFDLVPVVDADDQPVMEPYTITSATKDTPAVMGTRPRLHQVLRMVTKTRPKYRQDVIEDCLDLNSGQIIAAMYGALQQAMQRIEALEQERLIECPGTMLG